LHAILLGAILGFVIIGVTFTIFECPLLERCLDLFGTVELVLREVHFKEVHVVRVRQRVNVFATCVLFVVFLVIIVVILTLLVLLFGLWRGQFKEHLACVFDC
jgi:hypothetical protein